MQWLNYHHLQYFYLTAKLGGVTAAAKELRLSQPTVSSQIRQLQSSLGTSLFTREAKLLQLTDMGRVVFRYADEIFSLGSELLAATQGKPTARALRLAVGVADVLPKLVVYGLLRPALELKEPVHLVCKEQPVEDLLAQLSVHALDLVLSDSPISPTVSVRAYNHLLGESSIEIWAAAELALQLRRGFPASLDGAPALLPVENTFLRRSLDLWFQNAGVQPRIVGEFEDSALMKSFAQHGTGFVVVPSVTTKELRRQYGLRKVATIPELKERFYAITVERRIKHPGVVAISEAGRRLLDH